MAGERFQTFDVLLPFWLLSYQDVLAETSVAAHFAKSVSAEEHRSRMKEIDEHEHQVELFKLSWKVCVHVE